MSVYKDEKHNCWYFRVYYTNSYGVRKQKYKTGFPTKKIAKEYELDFLNNPFNNNMTFNDLYQVYSKYLENELKPDSIRTTKSRFTNHILPYFGQYLITNINATVYNDWKSEILKKKFSYKYNSNLHRCMTGIMNYAMKYYGLEKNIPQMIGNFKKYDYIPNINFWNYEEFKKFIQVVDNPIYFTLFHILYFTGLRIGETLALTWNDFNSSFLDIKKSVSREKRNGKYIVTVPKTRSSIRKVQLDQNSINILNDLYSFYQNYIGFNKDWYIFGGIQPLARTTIERYKNNYCKKANVKQIKIHDFRHSHASLLLSKGIPISVISKRLGHDNINTTLRIYAHLLPEDEDKAIQILNNLP